MLVGRIDRVPGIGYIATNVVELGWIPLWPKQTWWVDEGSEVKGRHSPRLSEEVHVQAWRGHEIEASGRSFVRGLVQRLCAVGGAALVLATLSSMGARGNADALVTSLGLLMLGLLLLFVLRVFRRHRAADTVLAGLVGLILGAAVRMPILCEPLGLAMIALAWTMRRVPLASPARAAAVATIARVKTTVVLEALAKAGVKARVPRAVASPPKPAPAPAPPAPAEPPAPPKAPEPPPAADGGPRFLR
jgi:hypothetical protein